MQIYFSGAETHLPLLQACGVERIAVNVSNLARSQAKLDAWATRERLGALEWVMYVDSADAPPGPAYELLMGAETLPEAIIGPVEWYDQSWLLNSDLSFLPTWQGIDHAALRYYADTFDGVALPDAVVDNPTMVHTARAALNRLGQLAAITGRSKGIERFEMLLSSAWWSVQKYGETQVWTAQRLVRLNAEDKMLKRRRYAPAMEQLGCDVDKILAEDPDEVLRCAVLSWLALEQHVGTSQRSLVTTPAQPLPPSNVVPIHSGVASGTSVARLQMLPGVAQIATPITTTDENGNEVTTQRYTIGVTESSLRQCNSCSLAAVCPAFTPHTACSYKIPVAITTKTQLMDVLRSLVEMQTQRIFMARFAEEVIGTQDIQVGKEMDRLFGMVEKWKEIEDSRDTVKFSLEAKGNTGELGVLSRLFGTKAGQGAVALEDPMTSNEVIEEMVEEDDEGT